MSQPKNDGFDPTDPIGTWRTIRDMNLDAWAKSMSSMVNTEVFSKAIGVQLDTMLAASAPLQKSINQYMETYLAQLSMPSRTDVISQAERLTNIEMRLDDMQAQVDEVQAQLSSILHTLDMIATAVAQPVAGLSAEADGESKAAPARRSRKAAEA
jgi:hypothetical protein